MKNSPILPHQTAHRLWLIAYAAALAIAWTLVQPYPGHADGIKPPPVPANIEVPEGNKVFLEGHAIGTQDYICLPSVSDFTWRFFGPQATLFNDHDQQITTHFLSPNPDEDGTARPTWQHSRDTSTVWAMAIQSSSDPAFVASGAIPWLLLQVVGDQDGPTGGDKLSEATFIQRLNTAEGVAPAPGDCTAEHVGQTALVPYTADYFFYKATHRK
jgi:Protein of unknown function (DUF3455)